MDCEYCGTVILENGAGAHHSATCPIVRIAELESELFNANRESNYRGELASKYAEKYFTLGRAAKIIAEGMIESHKFNGELVYPNGRVNEWMSDNARHPCTCPVCIIANQIIGAIK